MFRPRVIPILLVRGRGLYKTVKFREPQYLGDPMNAVRIFSSKGADELILLDIGATPSGASPDLSLIQEIADETFMPFAVGGGIRGVEEARLILGAGAEKVVVNTAAIENPTLVTDLAREFGSQSVVVSIDAQLHNRGGYHVFARGGSARIALAPDAWAREAERLGAGEIVLTSIDRDGTMDGYDIALIMSVARSVNIPVIAAGGAGSIEHFRAAIEDGGASAVAAGSFFVFHGRRRAVLISYPSNSEMAAALAGVEFAGAAPGAEDKSASGV